MVHCICGTEQFLNFIDIEFCIGHISIITKIVKTFRNCKYKRKNWDSIAVLSITLVVVVNTKGAFYHFVSTNRFRFDSSSTMASSTVQTSSTCAFPCCFSVWLIILTKFMTIQPKLTMTFIRYFNLSMHGVFWWKYTEERRRKKREKYMGKLVIEWEMPWPLQTVFFRRDYEYQENCKKEDSIQCSF